MTLPSAACTMMEALRSNCGALVMSGSSRAYHAKRSVRNIPPHIPATKIHLNTPPKNEDFFAFFLFLPLLFFAMGFFYVQSSQ